MARVSPNWWWQSNHNLVEYPLGLSLEKWCTISYLLEVHCVSTLHQDMYINCRITTTQTSRSNEMKNWVLDTEGKILNGKVQPLDINSIYNVHLFGADPCPLLKGTCWAREYQSEPIELTRIHRHLAKEIDPAINLRYSPPSNTLVGYLRVGMLSNCLIYCDHFSAVEIKDH